LGYATPEKRKVGGSTPPLTTSLTSQDASEIRLMVRLTRFHAHRGKRHRPRGILGLRRNQAQGAADPLESVDDLQLGVVQADIQPAEPEQLPTPQPEVKRQHVQRRQPVTGLAVVRERDL